MRRIAKGSDQRVLRTKSEPESSLLLELLLEHTVLTSNKAIPNKAASTKAIILLPYSESPL